MALADSGKAIGAVSDLLIERLGSKTNVHVQISRPDAATSGIIKERLNLFLYEAAFDPSLKNTPLDEGQPAPLWMVLRYLMTAYDDVGESDTVNAHRLLGEACRSLQEIAFLELKDTDPAVIRKPLVDSPEELKVTFVDASSDLIAKVMQGTDELYRFAIAFEVRPVMIAVGLPPSYNLLVGVDYSQGPPVEIGEAGVKVAALPSLGATITEISPSSFGVGDTITIYGSELHLTGLSVRLGTVDLPVTAQSPSWLKCVIRPDLVHGGAISAGGLPVTVLQTLPSGRTRRSNTLVGDLLPTLDTASFVSQAAPAPPAGRVYGRIDLTGILLGTPDDYTFVALFRDGEIVVSHDVLTDPVVPPPPPQQQTARSLTIPIADALPTGSYIVLVRVNGVQAKTGLTIDLVP